MIKKIIFSVIAIALLIATFVVLSSNKKEIESAASYLETRENIPVEVITAQKKTYAGQLSFTGTFNPVREVSFGAETQGKVKRVYVEEGDYVKAGQLIANIDNELLQVKLQGEEAQLKKAEEDLRRYENLMKDSATSEVQLKQARLNHTLAKTAVKNTREQISKTSIAAPMSGYLTAKNFEEGAIVSPGSPIGTITNIDRLKFSASVPEEQMMQMKVGQNVKVKADIYPDTTFEGLISQIAVKGDGSHNFKIEAVVENNEEYPLRAGMYGNLMTDTESQVTNFLIPRSALINESGQSTVFLAKNDKAVLTEVTKGNLRGDQVAITSGLEEGNRVVVRGAENLTDGITLQIK